MEIAMIYLFPFLLCAAVLYRSRNSSKIKRVFIGMLCLLGLTGYFLFIARVQYNNHFNMVRYSPRYMITGRNETINDFPVIKAETCASFNYWGSESNSQGFLTWEIEYVSNENAGDLIKVIQSYLIEEGFQFNYTEPVYPCNPLIRSNYPSAKYYHASSKTYECLDMVLVEYDNGQTFLIASITK